LFGQDRLYIAASVQYSENLDTAGIDPIEEHVISDRKAAKAGTQVRTPVPSNVWSSAHRIQDAADCVKHTIGSL
jgi:hypothetical protein